MFGLKVANLKLARSINIPLQLNQGLRLGFTREALSTYGRQKANSYQFYQFISKHDFFRGPLELVTIAPGAVFWIVTRWPA